MRNLNVMEIEAVSGAGLWSSITSAFIGGLSAASAGSLVGGTHGGDGGGLLGFGLIGQAVGMIVGCIMGGLTGAISAAIIGWNDPDMVISLSTQFLTSVINGTFV